VAITLTLRDFYHERVTENVGAIENARAFYEVEELESATNAEVFKIEDSIGAMRGESAKGLTTMPGPSIPGFDRLEMEADIRHVRVERLESLAELAGNSPPLDESYIKELSTKNLYVDLDIVTESLIARQKKENDPGHLPSQELLREIADINKRVDAAQSMLIVRLIGRDEEYLWFSTVLNWVSWSLIGIGVALSLAGQIVGKPEEAPEVRL
jgi:hypothetical protein